jgi:hypothetical protein
MRLYIRDIYGWTTAREGADSMDYAHIQIYRFMGDYIDRLISLFLWNTTTNIGQN